MKKDPAIDEIRAVRHKISEEFGHDSDRLIDHLIEKEKEAVKRGQYSFIGTDESCIEARYRSA